MTDRISDAMLSMLAGFVENNIGLHFPKRRLNEFKRGIICAAGEFGFDDPESFGLWLLSAKLTKSQIEMLASCLTVGETYFFRDKRIFKVLEEHILTDLIERRLGDKYLRIWSVGCCTGEEPYSIAIMLNRFHALKDWHISILATDINPRFLEKALNGVYTKWSFRDTPKWVKDGYFRKTDSGLFEIIPDIKKAVTFSTLNLSENTYPSILNNTNAMDIILCRNVLMYFTEGAARQVIGRLEQCLVDGGWLIVGPSEASSVIHAHFSAVNFENAILYRKEKGKSGKKEAVYVPKAVPEPVFKPEPKTEIPEPVASFEVSVTEETLRAFYNEALILYEHGRYDEASDILMDMLSDGRKAHKTRLFSDAVSLLIKTYANQGMLTDALRWCGKAIAYDKVNPNFYFLQATIFQEQNQIEQAIASLKKVIYLAPNFVPAHYGLGNFMLKQGKLERSRKYFENALDLLSAYPFDQVIPECGGITAGRLIEFINSLIKAEAFA